VAKYRRRPVLRQELKGKESRKSYELLLMTNRKLHMSFWLAPRLMTLD